MRCCIAFLVAAAAVVSAQPYKCDWSVNGVAGGEMSSSTHKCGSTVGQTAVGLSTASGLQVSAGFWLPDYNVGIQEPGEVLTDAGALITRLSAVTPNPSRGRTVLRYTLAGECQVSFVVCDLTGRVARILASGRQRRGAYSLHWDGRDGHGRMLARGVYLVRLSAGKYHATQKLVLER